MVTVFDFGLYVWEYLDARGTATDQRNSLACDVLRMVPFRGMDIALKIMQPINLRPLPLSGRT
jgi:hypothetical protein